jgi:hypothetical protein
MIIPSKRTLPTASSQRFMRELHLQQAGSREDNLLLVNVEQLFTVSISASFFALGEPDAYLLGTLLVQSTDVMASVFAVFPAWVSAGIIG